MKHLRRAVLVLALGLLATPAWSDIGQELTSLVEAGRRAEARDAIERVLQLDGTEASTDDRAAALRWLGRLEVAEKNWPAARTAYDRLARDFGETAAAADAATEIALLGALLDSLEVPVAQAAAEPPLAPVTPPRAQATSASREPPSVSAPEAMPSAPPAVEAPERTATAPTATTETIPQSPGVASGVLVGAFGTPFEAAEETGLQVQSFLASKDVASDFEATASQALRGRDAVVAYLLTRVRDLGRANLILVRSRWGFREFVEVESYGPDGALLWREKVAGGRALRDKTVKQNLLDRLWPKLEQHLASQ